MEDTMIIVLIALNIWWKNDEEGKKIQDIQERIYGYETRTLLTNNEVYKHSNDEHVYLMIALEIKDKNDF